MSEENILVYDPKDPSSTEYFYMDFDDVLATNEAITSVDSSISIVGSGKDPNLSSMLVGSASSSGTIASQLVTGGINGLTYRLKLTATTDKGQIIPLAADFPVRLSNTHC